METPAGTSELLRCIHVGLLCVQKRPEDRPTMPSVVLMLDSENPTLPQPKQPGFYSERYLTETDSSSTGTFRNTYTMMKDVTITTVQGRQQDIAAPIVCFLLKAFEFLFFFFFFSPYSFYLLIGSSRTGFHSFTLCSDSQKALVSSKLMPCCDYQLIDQTTSSFC